MRSLHFKLAALAAGVVLVVAGLLIAPSLMDWTEYRVAFATRLSSSFGRPVSIDGDVDFVLLPRPAFNAEEVRIGGAVSDDFVGVERLSARLAFLPLLTGRLQFRELVLHRAEARITRTAAGDIDFLDQAPAREAQPGAVQKPAPTPFDLDVDRVLIDDGALSFEDVGNGLAFELRGIDATILSGRSAPVTIASTFSIGNTPLILNADIGASGGDGGRTMSVTMKLAEANVGAKFSGALVLAAQRAEVRGDLTVNGVSSVALLAGLGAINTAAPLPAALRKPFSLKAKIAGDAASAVVDITSLDVGGTSAKGQVTWRAATPPVLDVALELGVTDIGAWKTAALTSPAGFFSGFVGKAHAQDAGSGGGATASSGDLTVNFEIKAPLLSYREQTLRDGILRASLTGDTLTVSEAALELPGATHLKTSGRALLKDTPTFDGTVEMQSSDVRSVVNLLGVDTGRIAPGRLTIASLRAAVHGAPSQFALTDISANVDTSVMTGRASWTAAPRPALALDIAVNTLNVDAYLMPRPVAVPAAPGSPGQAAKREAYGVTPQFADLSSLADMDADVRLQVDALTAGGTANGKVGIDVSLKDNALTVRSASFENVAGATAWFSGGVSGFGVSPLFDNVQFDLSIADTSRFGRFVGWNIPAPLRGLSPIAFTGTVNGGFAQATLASTLKAAGLTLHVDGKGLTLDQQPRLTFNLEAAQPSYAALMRSAGMIWPTSMPDPGAVKFAAQVTYEKAATKIENLALRIGENTVAGDLNIARGEGMPNVTGALKDVGLSIDALWPKTPAAMPVRTAARPVALIPDAGIWSSERFDWTELKDWRGNVKVSGAALTLRGVQLQDFAFTLGLANGLGELTGWSGKIFGAPGQIYLGVSAAPEPTVQGEVAFIGGDLKAIGAAINGGAASLKSGGHADFAASFRMQGATPAALAGDLSGSGTVKLSTADAGTGPISALLGAVAAANQLEGLSGQKGGTVTLESRFSAADGRIKIEDATVASKSYGGAFTGTIDLPRWQADLSGRLRLEARDAGARPASVPIAVKGALDLPNITLLPP